MARNIGIEMPFEPIWERVRRLTGWTKLSELAAFLDITPSTVNQAKKRNSFPIAWAYRISRNYGTYTDWLLNGRETVSTDELTAGVSRILRPDSGDAVPHGSEKIRQTAHTETNFGCQDYKKELAAVYIAMIEPFLAPDGSPIVSGFYSYAFHREWLSRIAEDPLRLALMISHDDAMTPEISKGDMVMLDYAQTRIFEGSIYGMRLENSIVIKRLSLRPDNRVLVISDNREQYPSYETDTGGLDILGRIIWHARILNLPGKGSHFALMPRCPSFF